MKLGQVLEGDFFTEYIKIGVLTMYLDKETYERAGLAGKPHGVKGKRGLKPRWTPVPDPLSQHYPVKYTSYPRISGDIPKKIPSLKPPATILTNQSRLDLDEFATDIYEWLSLVRLDSPRINVDDKIDSYLSSYAVPGYPDDVSEGKLCRVSWQGFIPPRWTRQTLADVILALPSKSWFSLSTTTFARDIVGDSADCTIFRPPNASGEYLLWDIKKHN
ncbi:hypothetical protein Daesc_001260 [Daldinia eschscholtzii]|uniref:Uncharacterized protein n=1 Tax=Daldinia eschscholtzii TaxID=292717 RepID=A0AAX6N0R7_9PEZI